MAFFFCSFSALQQQSMLWTRLGSVCLLVGATSWKDQCSTSLRFATAGRYVLSQQRGQSNQVPCFNPNEDENAH